MATVNAIRPPDDPGSSGEEIDESLKKRPLRRSWKSLRGALRKNRFLQRRASNSKSSNSRTTERMKKSSDRARKTRSLTVVSGDGPDSDGKAWSRTFGSLAKQDSLATTSRPWREERNGNFSPSKRGSRDFDGSTNARSCASTLRAALSKENGPNAISGIAPLSKTECISPSSSGSSEFDSSTSGGITPAFPNTECISPSSSGSSEFDSSKSGRWNASAVVGRIPTPHPKVRTESILCGSANNDESDTSASVDGHDCSNSETSTDYSDSTSRDSCWRDFGEMKDSQEVISSDGSTWEDFDSDQDCGFGSAPNSPSLPNTLDSDTWRGTVSLGLEDGPDDETPELLKIPWISTSTQHDQKQNKNTRAKDIYVGTEFISEEKTDGLGSTNDENSVDWQLGSSTSSTGSSENEQKLFSKVLDQEFHGGLRENFKKSEEETKMKQQIESDESFIEKLKAVHASIKRDKEKSARNGTETFSIEESTTETVPTSGAVRPLHSNREATNTTSTARHVRFADEQGLPIATVHNLGGDEEGIPVANVVVLLVDPKKKKFEFLQGEYAKVDCPTANDLLKQLPSFTASDWFKGMEFVALYGNRGPRKLDLQKPLMDLGLARREVIVAVMKDAVGDELVRGAQPLLSNNTIMSAVRRATITGRSMKYILNSQQLEEEMRRRQEEDPEEAIDLTITADTDPITTNECFDLDQYKIYMPSNTNFLPQSEVPGIMTFENDFEMLAGPTWDDWESLQYPDEDEARETFSMQYVHLGLAATLGFLFNLSQKSK